MNNEELPGRPVPKRFSFRFSLITLIITCAIFGSALGLIVQQWHEYTMCRELQHKSIVLRLKLESKLDELRKKYKKDGELYIVFGSQGHSSENLIICKGRLLLTSQPNELLFDIKVHSNCNSMSQNPLTIFDNARVENGVLIDALKECCKENGWVFSVITKQ